MAPNEFFKALLHRNGLIQHADGRALYAYRCTHEEYRQLEEMAKSGDIGRLLSGKDRIIDPHAPALLCLYAAERLRRNHEGGAFRWSDALGAEPKDLHKTYEHISAGIKRGWKREIRTVTSATKSENHRYLYTLACEGGLPLKLLKHSSVREYFKALQQIRAKNDAALTPTQAEEESSTRVLSKIWHEPYVFSLVCDLINGVAQLQQYLHSSADPIAQLDAHDPRWRDALPINAEDAELEHLLLGLINEAQRLSLSGRNSKRGSGSAIQLQESSASMQALAVKTGLVQTGERWRVHRAIDLADKISNTQIERWLGRKPLSTRLEVMIELDGVLQSLARLKLLNSGDWSREWLTTAKSVITSTNLAIRLRCHAADDGSPIELPLQLANIPGDQPLLFTWINERWQYRSVCRDGSKLAAAEVLLALPDGWLADVSDETSMGSICGYALCRVSGGVYMQNVLNNDEERWLHCGTDDHDIAEFQLTGNFFYDDLSSPKAYQGAPQLRAIGLDGRRATLPAALEWAPTRTENWSTDFSNAYGRITLRCGTAFRETVNVVPESLEIKIDYARGNQPAKYHFAKSKIEILSCEHSGVAVDGLDLICQKADVPEPVVVLLSWPAPARAVQLKLPYPQRHATFKLNGRALDTAESVPVCRLGGVTLTAMDQPSDQSLQLWNKQDGVPFKASDGNAMKFVFKKGQLDASLSALLDDIKAKLAESETGEVGIELRQAGRFLTSLKVMDFAYALVLDLKAQALELIGRTAENLTVHISRVEHNAPFEPSDTVPLIVDADAQLWRLPPLATGVWCAIGYIGNWACSKPLFFECRPQHGTMATMFPGLAAAAKPGMRSEFDHALLGQNVDTVIARLAANPCDPDWQRFWQLAKLAKSVESAQFQPLKQFLLDQPFLSMALFQASSTELETLLVLIESLPICFETMPVEQIKATFIGWLAAMRKKNSSDEIKQLCTTAFKNITTRLPYWGNLSSWLTANENFVHTPSQELRLARTAPEKCCEQLQAWERDLQQDHGGDTNWPETPALNALKRDISPQLLAVLPPQWSKLAPHLQDIRYAPIVVASCAFQGVSLNKAMRLEIRALKDFDAKWFTQAFLIALTLYLAQEKL